jgi:hypothetical protein
MTVTLSVPFRLSIRTWPPTVVEPISVELVRLRFRT